MPTRTPPQINRETSGVEKCNDYGETAVVTGAAKTWSVDGLFMPSIVTETKAVGETEPRDRPFRCKPAGGLADVPYRESIRATNSSPDLQQGFSDQLPFDIRQPEFPALELVG